MFQSIISVITISLISFLILIFLSQKKFFNRNLGLFLALASGALLGEVFLHIIPEFDITNLSTYSVIILLSIFVNYFVESILNFKHCHDTSHHHEENLPKQTLRFRLISSDIIHNLLDGITVFASFAISKELGIATSLAILFHEIPKEISSLAMLVNAGFSKNNAIKINLLTAAFAIFGVITSNFINLGSYSNLLLAFVAGNFLYIAMTDILPEMHGESSGKMNTAKLISFGLGIALMWGVRLVS